MIKINLALRKRAAAVGASEKAGGGFSIPKFDSEVFKEPQLRKLALGLIVLVMASYAIDEVKTDQLHKLDQDIEKVQADNNKAKAELAKTAGYDALKKQIDDDEKLIRTKLETIQKLMADRQVPPKLLLSLSNMIPKDVWLSDFTLSDTDLKIKGSSIGFDPVADFMKSMNDSDYLNNVKLMNSANATDPVAGEVTNFELEAKRKEEKGDGSTKRDSQ